VGAIGTKVGDGLEQDRSRIGAGRAGPESQDQNRSWTSNWELDRSWSNSNKSWRRTGAGPEQGRSWTGAGPEQGRSRTIAVLRLGALGK
jgi:hypothetical protein